MKRFYLTVFASVCCLISFAQDVDSIYTIANLKYRARDLEGALAKCEKVLILDSLHHETLLLKGMIFYDDGQFENAVRWITKSLSVFERNHEAYYQRGIMYYYENMFEESAEDFTRAAAITIGNEEYYYYKGMSLLKIGETYEGCRAVKRAGKLGIDEDVKSVMEEYDCKNVKKPESSKFLNKMKEKFNIDDDDDNKESEDGK